MLVLTRRPHERIIIGDGPERIIIEITDVYRGAARLGITAPPNLRIMREELLQEKPEDRSE